MGARRPGPTGGPTELCASMIHLTKRMFVSCCCSKYFNPLAALLANNQCAQVSTSWAAAHVGDSPPPAESYRVNVISPPRTVRKSLRHNGGHTSWRKQPPSFSAASHGLMPRLVQAFEGLAGDASLDLEQFTELLKKIDGGLKPLAPTAQVREQCHHRLPPFLLSSLPSVVGGVDCVLLGGAAPCSLECDFCFFWQDECGSFGYKLGRTSRKGGQVKKSDSHVLSSGCRWPGRRGSTWQSCLLRTMCGRMATCRRTPAPLCTATRGARHMWAQVRCPGGHWAAASQRDVLWAAKGVCVATGNSCSSMQRADAKQRG